MARSAISHITLGEAFLTIFVAVILIANCTRWKQSWGVLKSRLWLSASGRWKSPRASCVEWRSFSIKPRRTRILATPFDCGARCD